MGGASRRLIALPERGAGALSVLDLGPPQRSIDLVFLHANGFNALTYRRILAPLAARFRILAIDQRGHGASTLAAVAEGREDWLDLRDDLLALLKTLNLTDVVLAGHSMGATTCLLAAAEAIERVAALVLLDPVVIAERPSADQAAALADAPLVRGALRRRAEFPSRSAARDAYLGRGAFATWPADMVDDYVAGGFVDLPQGGVRLACEPTWEASNYRSHAHDPWAAFKHSLCPILCLRAEDGSTFQLGGAPAALLAAPRISLMTVPGTSHFLPMERPELVTEVLDRALASKTKDQAQA